jgi:hypothetical protein
MKNTENRYLCNMKSRLVVILFLTLFFAGCDDTDKPGKIKTSGSETIDNSLYGTGPYYALGFNFAKAEKVSSLSTPKPDLILESGGTPDIFILQTGTGLNGFYLKGEYSDEASAILAFNNLTAFSIYAWEEWANPVKPNQVWIYRSADEHYAKIRIISTSFQDLDPRDYAECTFEWVYQPDGTLTFPGK